LNKKAHYSAPDVRKRVGYLGTIKETRKTSKSDMTVLFSSYIILAWVQFEYVCTIVPFPCVYKRNKVRGGKAEKKC
jgi:hypothetical protein